MRSAGSKSFVDFRQELRWLALLVCVTLIPVQATLCPAQSAPAPQETRSAAESPPVLDAGRIEKATKTLVEFEFVQKPLIEVASAIQEKAGIPVVVDTRALDARGISSDLPVTRKTPRLPLESALDLLLFDLRLTWLVWRDVLLITTRGRAEKDSAMFNTVVYPVGDLTVRLYRKRALVWQLAGSGGREQQQSDQEPATSAEALMTIVVDTIHPTTWDRVGGAGSARPCTVNGKDALVILQSYQVRREIAKLLEELRQMRGQGRAPTPPEEAGSRAVAEEKHAAAEPSPSLANVEIETALSRPVELEFLKTPFAEVATCIEKMVSIPVRIDQRALDDVGFATQKPITAKLPSMPLESALDLLLLPLDLEWTIWNNVLLLTTRDRTEEYRMMFVGVYPLSDLTVISCKESSEEGEQEISDQLCGTGRASPQTLADMITNTIDPAAWGDIGGLGGRGTVIACSVNGTDTLVVANSLRVHRKIQRFLTRLRHMAASQAGRPAAAGAISP